MTPTPDTKKIAEEMRRKADTYPDQTGDTPKAMRAWADALDPQPTMGIEVAHSHLRAFNDGRVTLASEQTHAALAVMLAHYEATKAEKPATFTAWATGAMGECSCAMAGHEQYICPVHRAPAAPRKTGELVTEVWAWEYEMIRQARAYMESKGQYGFYSLFHELASRCVVRP